MGFYGSWSSESRKTFLKWAAGMIWLPGVVALLLCSLHVQVFGSDLLECSFRSTGSEHVEKHILDLKTSKIVLCVCMVSFVMLFYQFELSLFLSVSSAATSDWLHIQSSLDLLVIPPLASVQRGGSSIHPLMWSGVCVNVPRGLCTEGGCGRNLQPSLMQLFCRLLVIQDRTVLAALLPLCASASTVCAMASGGFRVWGALILALGIWGFRSFRDLAPKP